MENLKFKTRAGIEIELDSMDMHRVHEYYEVQCTADYIRDNHEDWSEDKIQSIAYETRRQMFKYDYTEEEAIDIATDWYEEEYEGVDKATRETERLVKSIHNIITSERNKESEEM